MSGRRTADVPEMKLPTSTRPDPAEVPGLRWGVLGAGWIASEMVHAIEVGEHGSTQQQVVAVGSRDLGRAQAFVDEHCGAHVSEHGPVRAHGSYADLVTDPDVDVVYVATPHSEHLEHALLAVRAGKHVLVEKAFTADAAQARELVAAIREAGVFAMEAMWSRFLPHYDVVRQVLDLGLLGELSTVLADHGQRLWPDGPRRLADPALAGGSLLDLGIYPLSFASMVLGGIDRVAAAGTLTDEGVDARVAMSVRGPSGAVGSLSCDMSTRTPTTAVVAGRWARLELDGEFYGPTTMRLVGSDDVVLDEMTGDPVEMHRGLRHETCEVALRVHAGETESPLMPLDESVALMEHMDSIRSQLA
ncbi:Gfo/Idh/MocA family oxidoreductase [Janibacter sp. UYMM211]|uniref:Gfo/Idh/MocA family protein n=1 Tax=Janibacter sp. UYMM211 TaxID=3156342 RepID=UPI0033985683